MQRQNENKIINKNIHFLWAGGKTIPEKNLDVIREWARINPDYEVILWVDEKTTSQEEMAAFREKIASLDVKITIKDITEEKIVNPAIRHELDHLYPNYGKSSDMIRLAALYKYGGIYLDSDVDPSGVPFGEIEAEHGILFSPWTQTVNQIGNDVLLCAAGNETMGKLVTDVVDSYNAHFSKYLNKNNQNNPYRKYNFSPYAYEMRMPAYINTNLTLEQTGPVFLRRALCHYNIIQSDDGDVLNVIGSSGLGSGKWKIDPAFLMQTGNEDKDEYRPKYFNERTISEKSWTSRKPREIKSQDEAIDICVNHILYEIEHTHLLRLSDYVDEIVEMFRCDEKQTANAILTKLDAKLQQDEYKHLSKQIEAAQLVPYMTTTAGQQFFDKHMQHVRDGLHLYHMIEFQDLDQVIRCEDQEKIMMLKQIARCFNPDVTYYFGENDNTLNPAGRRYQPTRQYDVQMNPEQDESVVEHCIEYLELLVDGLELEDAKANILKRELKEIIAARVNETKRTVASPGTTGMFADKDKQPQSAVDAAAADQDKPKPG